MERRIFNIDVNPRVLSVLFPLTLALVFALSTLVYGQQCNSIPVTGTGVSACSAGTYTLNALAQSTNARYHKWYDALTGGTLLLSVSVSPDLYPPYYSNSSLSLYFTATRTVYVEVTCADGSASAPRIPVTFTLNSPPTVSLSSSPVTPTNMVGGSSAVLTATGGTSYIWHYGTQYGPSIGTASQYTASKGGTYYVTCVNSTCGTSQVLSIVVNYQPVTDAGWNQTIGSNNSSYTIYGSGSDPEGQPITYGWSKISGPTVTMSNATSSALLLTNLNTGTYTFQLTATDNMSASSSSSMNLVVSTIANNYNYVQKEKVNIPGQTTLGQVSVLNATNKNVSINYLDGLGKTNQVMKWQGSPGGKDVLIPYEYDDLSRPKMSFLPIGTSTTTGYYHPNATGLSTSYTTSEQYVFYNSGQNAIAADTKPYSDRLFETNPLGRIVQQGSQGAAWQPNVTNGYTAVTYSTNNTNDVRLWTATNNGVPSSQGLYAAWMLSSTTVTSEQGLAKIEYSNRQGLKVLEKVQTALAPSGYAETYYVYDNYNRLRFILPPEFIRLYPTSSSAVTVVKADVDRWCYQSLYDNLGRLIQSKVPGSGWVYQIYDCRDRVALAQDSLQRGTNTWSYTKYDGLDRPVSSGIYSATSPVSQSSMQATEDTYGAAIPSSANIVLTSSSGGEVIASKSITLSPGFDFAGTSGTFHAWINDPISNINPDAEFPTQNIEKLVATYYDDYSTCTICQDPNYAFVSESWNTTSNEPNQMFPAVKGKIVGSSVKILGSNNTWLNTVTYYNRHGQIIQAIGSNHLGGRDRISILMDFKGKKLEDLESSIGYSSGGINTMRRVLSYDNMGRLLTVQHQINSQPIIIMSSIQYNELGQSIRKNLHSGDGGSTYLQSLDYRYNIRGWLNNVNNIPTGDDSNDYFGMDLTYNGTVSGTGAGNTPRTDGMISAIRWKQDLGQKRRLYNFTYDGLNRISGSNQKMSRDNSATWTGEPDYFSETGLTYDLNGNILTLNRNMEYFSTAGSYTADQLDQLSYTYGAGANNNGNQLQYVKENSTSSNKLLGFKDGGTNATGDPDYTYDANGNVAKDQNKSITSITYYFNNLPSKVTFIDNSYLQNTYDAAGIKLSQAYYNAAGQLQTTTDYVGGFVFLNGQVLVINTAEGRITAPTYNNLMDNREAGSTDGYTPSGTVTVGTAYVNSQTYVTAQCNQASGTPGVWPIRTNTVGSNGGLKVKQGETYIFKVLGYQSVGTNAYLFVANQSGANVVWTGAQLPVGSANENWATSTITVPAGTTELKLGVLWNGGGTGNTVYINRVALYKNDFEYNYFMADQVGSNRVVLQTDPGTQTYMATMETENQSTEVQQFQNMTSSQIIVFSAANHTPGGNEAIKMNTSFRVGPSKSIKVYPGDKIDASVYSYYASTSGYTKTPLATMMPLIATAFGGVSGAAGDPGSIFSNVGNNNGNSVIAGLSPDKGPSQPSAYLNYILFDKDYLPLAGQSIPVPGTPNAPQLLSIPTITAPELGYVFIYLSYDNDAGGDVYFDDLKITVQESPVIEVSNYYPFGMVSYTWLRPGETDNAYLFQGKELIAQTGWHDFGSRMYWADLGRWFATDPQKQYSSPYLAMGDVPMMGRDPNGEVYVIDDLVAAAYGSIANVIGNWSHIVHSRNIFQGFEKYVEYSTAGAAGGWVALYSGVGGFAVAGALNLAVDNQWGYANGWSTRSFVNGGLSSIGAAEAGYAAAAKAGAESVAKSQAYYAVEEEVDEAAIKRLAENAVKETFKDIRSAAMTFLQEGAQNAAKEYVNTGTFSLNDFIAGGIGGLVGGLTKLDNHMLFTNAAKEGVKSVATSLSTSALKGERLKFDDLPKDLVKGAATGFLTGSTFADPWAPYLKRLLYNQLSNLNFGD